MIRTRRYAFQRRGPKRLELRHTRTWSEVTVRMDAVEVGRTDIAALREGVEYRLFDHSLLRIWIEPSPAGGFFVNLTRNGHPLPGSGSDPLTAMRTSVVMLWILVATNTLLVGVKAMADSDEQPDLLPLDYAALGTGLLVAVLGGLAWRRSSLSLILAWITVWGGAVAWWAAHPYPVVLLQAVPVAVAMMWFTRRSIRASRELDAMRLPIRHSPEHAA
jgi:hypothetical protein